MNLNKFLAFVFLVSSVHIVHAQDATVYDIDLTRERVKKVHGDFVLKLQGDWKSSLEGRVESWKWAGNSWKCGTKDEPLACADWTPLSFQIFSKNFWQTWTPVKRESFEVIKAGIEPRVKPVEKTESANTEESGEPASPEAAQSAPIWGRNSIGELWTWKNSKGEELKLFLSARDSRIDRLEFKGQTEIFEWTTNPRKTLDLSRLIIEKNGTQAVVTKK